MEIIHKTFEDNIKSVAQRTAKQIEFLPRKVFLFSGHMVDLPSRKDKRFPPDKVSLAKNKIIEALEEFNACEDDLAFTQGACGGDILFTEACLEKGVKVIWLQPFNEPEFINKSVSICGDIWLKRYMDAKINLYRIPQSAINIFGELPKISTSSLSYVRCNLWLLYTAMSFGAEKVHFITLWNGEKGDGPGGTSHMYSKIKKESGHVNWINTNEL